MFWLKKIFGYRTQRAPSGSLPLAQLSNIAWGIVSAFRHAGIAVESNTVANTNSMLPTLDSNAVLLLEECQFSALTEGDIVTYWGDPKLWGPNKLILHRLNEQMRGGWWPLGDGNGKLDPELVTQINFHRRLCGILYGVRTADTNK